MLAKAARYLADRHSTPVERYWSRHTVRAKRFKSADESAQFLEWRSGQYPLFAELMDLWGEHEGEAILDYGCGPGNDLTGFLLESGARRVFGADVSEKALALAASRLTLHGIDTERYRLLQVSDAQPELSLADGSIDYVHCCGVIQHTSMPERVLGELARTLRPGGRGRIMVYNRDSLYYHLYTAYERRILKGQFRGLTAEEAFARNTDGSKCPVSRVFRPSEFCQLARGAGFETEYLGGYFADVELELWRSLGAEAAEDERLGEEHREFLGAVSDGDADGFPRFNGHYAGVGGVYAVQKNAS
jgi:ubiquinone/menaquinone biosynthesis C-methylase UbiE